MCMCMCLSGGFRGSGRSCTVAVASGARLSWRPKFRIPHFDHQVDDLEEFEHVLGEDEEEAGPAGAMQQDKDDVSDQEEGVEV